MAAGPCAVGLCGMTSAAWSRVLVRPQAVVSGAPGAECGPIRRWPGVQGLTATSEAGSGRASALLSTGLRDSGKAGVGRRNGPRAVAVCCLAVRTGRQAGRTGSGGLPRRRYTRYARFSNQARIRPFCCTLPHSSTRVCMEYVSLMPSVSAFRSTRHLHLTGRALGDRRRRARYTLVWPTLSRCGVCARQLGCLSPELLVSGAYCRGWEALCLCECGHGVSVRAEWRVLAGDSVSSDAAPAPRDGRIGGGHFSLVLRARRASQERL